MATRHRRAAPHGPDVTMRDVLVAYLSRHTYRLKVEHVRFRAGAPDAVHQLRVACRRLRSGLAVYGFEGAVARDLRAELRWLGGVLAEARDIEVLHERLFRHLGALPADLIVGPVASRLEDELGARSRTALSHVEAALSSERYFRLVDRLEAVAVTTPVVRVADTDHVLAALRHERKRFKTRDRAVRATTNRHERDVAMHEARKAAKRLRYVAEIAEPLVRKDSKRIASRAKKVQVILGEHQDTVLARAALREITRDLGHESRFTFRLLYGLEEVRARELEHLYLARARKRPR